MRFFSRKTRRSARARSFYQTRRPRFETLEPRAMLAAFTVVNTDDSGSGSLRQAILDANDNPGADEIGFNIPGGGVHTIAPLTILPPTSTVTIDGTTQPGFVASGSRLIELSGINTTYVTHPIFFFPHERSGLNLNGDSTVRGLAINRFDVGISVGGANNHIQSNQIGTNATGTAAVPNQWGVYLDGSNNCLGTNFDGTNDEDERNIISGNAILGVRVVGDSNLVAGNYVGTDATGMYAIANPVGISGGGFNGTIVGNVISGNDSGDGNDSGLNIGGFNVRVLGNLIGTDRTGETALPNHIGIFLQSSQQPVLIGGPVPEARNIITGNRIGIRISTDSIIQGNYIGRTLSGADLGNGEGISQQGGNSIIGGRNPGEGNVISGNGYGILLLNSSTGLDRIEGNEILHNRSGVSLNDGAANHTIGGTATGAGNTIAFNGTGVILSRSTGSHPPDPLYQYSTKNRIVGNSIFSNQELGIDLSDGGGGDPDGVTANDPLDADIGSNGFQNFPVLTAASSGASTRVHGSLNSTPDSDFVLDFYANSVTDPSGYGEGERYLGSTHVTTDASGNAAFDVTLTAASSAGEFISATATDSIGNTSEFSLVVQTPLNLAPIANAGGSYTVVQGGSIRLDASATTDAEQSDTSLVYEWDFDGDGQYDDAAGISPSFSALGFEGPISVSIAVRVTDDGGLTDVATSSVSILPFAMQVDPCDPTKTALVVGGTLADDTIVFHASGNAGQVNRVA